MKNFIYKKLIVYLILFQPIIDILTSFMVNADYQITIGIITKFLLLLLAVIYLVFLNKGKRKNNILILGVIMLFIILNTINNRSLLHTSLFIYLNYSFKYVYQLVMLLFFICYFKNGNIKLYQFRIPIIIVTITYFIAYFTKTSFPSYPLASFKIGENGWYSSANEFGNLLCILFPISIYNAFYNKDGIKLDTIFPPLLGIIMLMIGTKVGLLGFFGTLICYIFFQIIFMRKYQIKRGLIVTCLMLIISLVFFAKLPAVYNIKASADINTPGYVLLSGRAEFLRQVLEKYKDVNIYDKIIGHPYLEDNNHLILLIEQDFYDIYFMYGIVGLGLLLSMYTYCLYNIFKKVYLYYNSKRKLSKKYLLLLIVVFLQLGVAFMAGHSLLSPSVSTYLVLLMGMAVNLEFNNKNDKKSMLVSYQSSFLKKIDNDKYKVIYLVSNDSYMESNAIYPYYHRIINNNFTKKIFFNKVMAYLLVRNQKYDYVLMDNDILEFDKVYLKHTLAKEKYIVGKNPNKYFNKCISKLEINEL